MSLVKIRKIYKRFIQSEKKLTFDHKIIFSLFLMVFILKMPILNTPYYFDDILERNLGVWISEHNFFPFPELSDIFYYRHPPFFYEVLAITHSIFGIHTLVSHILVILFSFIGLVFTYLLGSHLCNRRIGLIASILLFFSPLYFAQSGIAQIAVPFTTLTITTMYFAIKNNKKLFITSGICLVLIKEPAILIFLMFFIYKLLKNRNLNKISFLKNSFFYSIPIIIFILWMVCNKLIYGWFLYPEHLSHFDLSSNLPFLNASRNVLQNFSLRFSEIFLYNYRWILTFIGITVFFKNIKKIKEVRYKEEFFLIFSIFLIIILFYSFISIFLIRYTLVLYPIFFILGSIALTKIFKQKIFLTGITILMLTFFITDWTGNRTNWCVCDLESNLEYLDSIKTHKLATKYIEQNYPNSVVLTDYPMVFELTNPNLGYMEKPIKIIYVKHEVEIENADIVYYSPQRLVYFPPRYSEDYFLSEMSNLNLTLLVRFEKNGKYTEIYEIN